MKSLKISLILLFAISTLLSAQNITILSVGKGENVTLKNTTAVGNIQWQTSTDLNQWTNVPNAVSSSYSFNVNQSAYYRLAMTNSNIVSYSDTAYLCIFDLDIPVSKSNYLYAAKNASLSLKSWYGSDLGFVLTTLGTDQFIRGSQATFGNIDLYQSIDMTNFSLTWMALYRGIKYCNYVIKNANSFDIPADQKLKDVNEAHFYRAFYYWLLTETWGNVLYSDDIKNSTFVQTTSANIYKSIFNDLWLIKNSVPASPANNQTVTKPAVESFLAKIHLFKGNNDSALYYAQKVINSYDYQLNNNTSAIWDIKNQYNKEMIFAVDNTVNTTGDVNAYSNVAHLFFTWDYTRVELTVMTRDIKNGRPWSRFMPTRYFMELYNETKDQRFNSFFQNTWICNTNNSTKTWPSSIIVNGSSQAVNASLIGKKIISLGDTAIYLSKTPLLATQKCKLTGSDIYSRNISKGYYLIDINDLYNADGTTKTISGQSRAIFFPLTNKLGDSTRTAINDIYSKRNSQVFRLAEMYLISAEANLNLSKPTDAYNNLLTLANARAVNNAGSAMLAAYGINSGSDITIDKILDERARELVGEQDRWFDLKRTGKLIERVRLYNPDAKNNIQNYHVVRPIPQEILDNNPGMVQNAGY